MARIGRSTLSLAAAAVLALAALAALMVLDLSGGSIDPSSLPVIQIGQSSTVGGEIPAQPAHQPGQGQLDSTSSTSAPGSVTAQDPQTTGSTVREIVNGGVHTRTSAGTGGGGPGSTAASGWSGRTASTNTTGSR